MTAMMGWPPLLWGLLTQHLMVGAGCGLLLCLSSIPMPRFFKRDELDGIEVEKRLLQLYQHSHVLFDLGVMGFLGGVVWAGGLNLGKTLAAIPV